MRSCVSFERHISSGREVPCATPMRAAWFISWQIHPHNHHTRPPTLPPTDAHTSTPPHNRAATHDVTAGWSLTRSEFRAYAADITFPIDPTETISQRPLSQLTRDGPLSHPHLYGTPHPTPRAANPKLVPWLPMSCTPTSHHHHHLTTSPPHHHLTTSPPPRLHPLSTTTAAAITTTTIEMS